MRTTKRRQNRKAKAHAETQSRKGSQRRKKKQKQPDVFDLILSLSEALGIEDWALNHDHYLYGPSKRK